VRKAVELEHVDLDVAASLSPTALGIARGRQPKRRPYPFTTRQLRRHLEVAVLQREPRAVGRVRREQARAPVSIGFFARFDAQDAVLHRKREVRLRIAERSVAEVAIPWCMRGPARARTARRHVERLVELLFENETVPTQVELLAARRLVFR